MYRRSSTPAKPEKRSRQAASSYHCHVKSLFGWDLRGPLNPHLGFGKVDVEGDDRLKPKDTSHCKAKEGQRDGTKGEVVLFLENVGESSEKAIHQAHIEGDVNTEKRHNFSLAQHGDWPLQYFGNRISSKFFGRAITLRRRFAA